MARVDSIQTWIWRYLRPYRGRIAGLAALSFAEVILRVLSPWPLKAVIDHVVGGAPLGSVSAAVLSPLANALAMVGGERERLLASIVVWGLAIQIGHQIALMFYSRLSTVTGRSMVRDLREQLFAHIQAMTLSQHSRTKMGDALYRLETDASCVEQLILRGFFPIVFSLVTLIAMFSILAAIDLELALVSLAIVPFLFAWLRFYTRRMQPEARRAKDLEAAMVQRLHESIGSIRLVKTYAREDFERERFSHACNRALEARLTTTKQESLFAAVIAILTAAGTSLVVLIGGLSVVQGRISLGTLLVLLAYLAFVYGPLCGIANTTGALQQAVASARRVRETFALATDAEGETGALPAAHLRGEVTFEQVSFGYEHSRPILNDVSFTARPGELVALVGLSGTGKTTLVSLITRLFEASSGRILIDGTDIRSFQLKSLRRAVGVVLQDAIALSGTIRDNLRYGRLDASEEQIEIAARAAHAHDFITSLRHGYDTVLGEGGSGLSGGQKQRLSIARAFLKNAPILILDEPTAQVDALSEALVVDGLRQLQKGRTTFVIAHRLSTVPEADRIMVLDKGRIVAQGTHEQLLATNPLYARLASQLAGAATAELQPALAQAV
jgi:ATP-binding cassette subfamily B protein/subfamily B ATP-binding cassette protein MsbA